MTAIQSKVAPVKRPPTRRLLPDGSQAAAGWLYSLCVLCVLCLCRGVPPAEEAAVLLLVPKPLGVQFNSLTDHLRLLYRPLPAAVWLDGVEQSLLYCRRHPLGENGQALFNLPAPPGKKQQQQRGGEVQQYRLIRRDLLKAALLHYAKQYRHLESSRKLLAKVGRAWAGLLSWLAGLRVLPHCV